MSASAGTLCVLGQVRLMGIRPDFFGATAEVAAQQLYRVVLEAGTCCLLAWLCHS